MHFSFWEKTGFAVLVTAWVIFGSHTIGNMLVHATPLKENVYKIEVADAGTSGAAEAKKKEPEKPITEMLASADVKKGAKVFGKCKGCHDDHKGGANKVGPELWNVLGRKIAGREGFAYSDALKKHDGVWDYTKLDHWLKDPKDFAPGTKMTFAGLKKASDRANIILYLRGQNDNPPPLP